MRPAATLFELAGQPPQERAESVPSIVRCRVCADVTMRAVPYERWQGANFTDQNKLRWIGGKYVCEPCVWAHGWNAPPGHPPPAEGKRGVNLRLFSHLFDARGYVYANKAQKPLIRGWLCAPKAGPWWCAIADTGQKHVVPWATVNPGSLFGVVRFEERDILTESRSMSDFCEAMCGLLTAGATKAEVEAVDYRPETWVRCMGAVRAFEARYGAERGSGLFALVLWLSQRDEDAVATRRAAEKIEKEAKVKRGRGTKRPRRGRDGGAPARGEGGVPRGRSERAEALAAAPRSRAPGDADERADERVGVDAGARAPARKPEQISLFGDGGADD